MLPLAHRPHGQRNALGSFPGRRRRRMFLVCSHRRAHRRTLVREPKDRWWALVTRDHAAFRDFSPFGGYVLTVTFTFHARPS